MISEPEILDFAGASFRSVWALELLLALRRAPHRGWAPSDIIKELRSSRVVVVEALNNLIAAGLVIEEDSGGYRYAVTGALDDMIADLERLYELKPTLVTHKII